MNTVGPGAAAISARSFTSSFVDVSESDLCRIDRELLKNCCGEILFADLNEVDPCGDCGFYKREKLLELGVSRRCSDGRRAARYQINESGWRVERHFLVFGTVVQRFPVEHAPSV